MIAFALAALVTCAGIDDTSAIQAAVNDGDVAISGQCMLDASKGVRVPSERVIDATDAEIHILPTCTSGKCRAFENVPGSTGFHFLNGTLIGSSIVAPGWQIGIRLDTAHDAEILGTKFINWRTDGIWVGGNTPSTEVRIAGVSVENSGRNGISIVNAVGVSIERCELLDTRPGADPGAGLDVEPGAPGDAVHNLTVIDTRAQGNAVGLYIQAGKGTIPGNNVKIIGCSLLLNRTHGVIVNSVHGAAIIDNVIEGSPIGISVGSHTEDRRATGVTILENKISADRAIVLAGVADSRLLGNSLGRAGRIEYVALGVSGDMLMDRNQ